MCLIWLYAVFQGPFGGHHRSGPDSGLMCLIWLYAVFQGPSWGTPGTDGQDCCTKIKFKIKEDKCKIPMKRWLKLLFFFEI